MSKSSRGEFAYQAVYRYLLTLTRHNTVCNEHKLPSLRDLAKRLKVSLSTVQHAYNQLEHEGRVRSVPKSGYYINRPSACSQHARLAAPVVSGDHDVLRLLEPPLPAMPALDHALLTEERRLARQGSRSVHERRLAGELMLRSALATRYTQSSMHCWSAEDVYLATDLQALLETVFASLSLQNEALLVPSPVCARLLWLLKQTGRRIVELPLDAHGCPDLCALAHLLRHERVGLALLPSCLASPLGRVIPVAAQRAMAALLEQHRVWVLENDMDSEHCFDGPPAARLRDTLDPERLLVLGSVHACVGAEAPYAYVLSDHEPVRQAFMWRDFRLPPLRQHALARLLVKGQVDAHLQVVRSELALRVDALCAEIARQVPGQLAFERPAGGRGLWIRTYQDIDMQRMLREFSAKGLHAAPGPMFSARGWHRQHVLLAWEGGRLNDLRQAVGLLRQRLARYRQPDR
ncbi:MAG: GntR family transcriptional regulator [Pseudomonas sp.]|jgi:DNA-binding transcriptional MocR family regulator|uniref:aminotransferase-like domain-containing protein n=1 Tax=Pseudomonas entomophila TaxID=312306 RepID=UPI0015E48472|nr:PLP-dependent aminotransferase family protein [Pseudomonas entomophila]MBA1192461.1 PLP-dependent aminotransferase family protein [Pseudomonas entomophila]MDF2490776.1 GntR family transcriptional regulator [Pseudomonas sp.]